MGAVLLAAALALDVVMAIVVVAYIRYSREVLRELVDIFRQTVESSRIVAEADRAYLRELIIGVATAVAGVERLEAAGVLVAADLAEAHRRADEVLHSDPPGTAADAASRQTADEAERP